MQGLKVGLKVKYNRPVDVKEQLLDSNHVDAANPVEIRSLQKKNKYDDTPTAVIVDSLGQYVEVYASQLEVISVENPA